MKKITMRQVKVILDVIDAVQGVMSENGLDYMDRFYRGGSGTDMVRDMNELLMLLDDNVVAIS